MQAILDCALVSGQSNTAESPGRPDLEATLPVKEAHGAGRRVRSLLAELSLFRRRGWLAAPHAGSGASSATSTRTLTGLHRSKRRTRDPGRRVRRREAGRGKPGRLSGLQRQLTACGRAALRRRWQDRAAAPSGRRKGGRSEGPAAERRCSPAGIDGNSKLPWRPAPPAGVWPAAADARIEGIRAASRPCLAVRRWIWTSSTRFWRSCG